MVVMYNNIHITTCCSEVIDPRDAAVVVKLDKLEVCEITSSSSMHRLERRYCVYVFVPACVELEQPHGAA